MERDRRVRPVLLVAAAAALLSLWLVAQEYVGDYDLMFGLWLRGLVLAGAAAVALAVIVRALKSRRFPWIEALLSTTILILTDAIWRVATAHDDNLTYKLVWVWIGNATPLIAIATWAVAVTLALGLVQKTS